MLTTPKDNLQTLNLQLKLSTSQFLMIFVNYSKVLVEFKKYLENEAIEKLRFK